MAVNKDHYYRLASNLPSERIKAALSLIKELEASDSKDDYKYTFNRLITGLASNHDSARLGFSMCLSEVLKLIYSNNDKNYLDYELTPESYLSILDETLNKQVKAKTKGKNLRAYLFGMIFGIKSLINSNIIEFNNDDDEKENENKNETSKILFKLIVDKLFEIALSKSWIREISIVTMIDFIKKSNASSNKDFMAYILTQLSENDLMISNDGLLFYLNIPSNSRDDISKMANLKNCQQWKFNNPLLKGNLPLLKNALIEQSVSSTDSNNDETQQNNKLQKGSWNPQLHYVWYVLINELLLNENELEFENENEQPNKKQKNSGSKKSKSKSKSKQVSEIPIISLSTFWPTFDETFFSNNSSSERKHTGLKILQLCFENPLFDPKYFEIIFSDNLTRCFINHLAKKDRMLNKLSNEVLAALLNYISKLPSTDGKYYLLLALEKQCILFDRITKNKTIKTLESNIEIDTWYKITSVDFNNTLFENLQKKTKERDFDETNTKKEINTFLLDFYLNLIRGNKQLIKNSVDNEKFILSINSILEKIINFIYNNPNYKEDENLIKIAKDRLQSILSDLMECSGSLIDWFGFIVEYLDENDNKIVASINENEELKEVKDNAKTVQKELNKLEENPKYLDIVKCLKFLLGQGLFELYNGDSESFGILSDLINISNDLIDSDNDMIENDLIETLVDLMLSYLPQESGMKKKIAIEIWNCLIDKIDDIQINRLFEILRTRENKQGMESLFNQAIDFDDGEDGDEKEGDEDEDDEIEEEHNHSSDDQSSITEEEDDDDDDRDVSEGIEHDEKSEIEKVEKSATLALAKALNVSEQNTNNKADENGDKKDGDISMDDEENDDEDDEEEEEDDGDDEGNETDESMSDEQMMALDSTLSAIFQQRQNSIDSIKNKKTNGNERKLQAKEARNLMALFKLRILDLIENFNNKKPNYKLNFNILYQLLLLIKTTADLKIGEKSHKLIKKICKNTVESEDDLEFKTFSIENLRNVLTFAKNSKINALSQACSQVAIYIVRSIMKNTEDEKYRENIELISAVYNEFMIDWATDSKNRITVSLFTDYVNWLNSKRSN